MIAIFHDDLDNDAHALFQTWRRDNPDGFFINCKGKRTWMVHRVMCTHPGNTEWGRDFGASLTKFKKACCIDFRALVHWARQNGPAELTFCNDCSPEENTAEVSELLTTAARQLAET